jgi:hypothetical protein
MGIHIVLDPNKMFGIWCHLLPTDPLKCYALPLFAKTIFPHSVIFNYFHEAETHSLSRNIPSFMKSTGSLWSSQPPNNRQYSCQINTNHILNTLSKVCFNIRLHVFLCISNGVLCPHYRLHLTISSSPVHIPFHAHLIYLDIITLISGKEHWLWRLPYAFLFSLLFMSLSLSAHWWHYISSDNDKHF